MRRRGPRPIGHALARFEERIAPPGLLAEVQRAWPTAAGPALARVAAPESERDGVVTLGCESAVWAQELELLSERLVSALNEVLGRPAVTRLRARALRRSG
jgi:predicted nucleic acid-binding Zn ribbon protein